MLNLWGSTHKIQGRFIVIPRERSNSIRLYWCDKEWQQIYKGWDNSLLLDLHWGELRWPVWSWGWLVRLTVKICEEINWRCKGKPIYSSWCCWARWVLIWIVDEWTSNRGEYFSYFSLLLLLPTIIKVI